MKIPALGIIALTPTAWSGAEFHPGIALAAARAGAIGVLDLEFVDSLADAQASLSKLLLEPRGGIGIRCGVEQIAEFTGLLNSLQEAPNAEKVVIVCVREQSFSKKTLSQCISQIRKHKLKAICEIVKLEEAQICASSGADGIIAKGHESGGRIGEETSFILLQRCIRHLRIPVWVQGGIGLHSAAACLAAGAHGVVLDNQLLLMRESPLSAEQKERLAAFDGTETEELTFEDDRRRVYVKPGSDSLKQLIEQSTQVIGSGSTEPIEQWRKKVRKGLIQARSSVSQLPQLMSLGQDVAFAASLARRFISVSTFISELRKTACQNVEMAIEQKALEANSSFALSQNTRYPILQGAMTRVSDTAEFAYKVSSEGGLPFLALALMRKEELEPLLEKTSKDLHGMSWGVGMLGFVPAELRQEQLELVLKYRPPFALIAGGRPDQAKELDAAGSKTYLHVPSPILLSSFIEMGARRFIFEGKECGGHVGPRSSFILWESMIDALLNALGPKSDPSEFHVVFAGGIHDQVSAAMVASMAAPLVQRGVRIGVLMGTAYLFTKEAVSTGAIVPRFQEEALKCHETVLLETGPGHAIRCINSPYKDLFDETRRKLEASGTAKNELRQQLEMMNLGRLRVASKGLTRGSSKSQSGSKLEKVPSDKQWSEGMYMIGQVAAMHDRTMSIKQLHESVTELACKHLESLELSTHPGVETKRKARAAEEPIAIIGMSCMFPKANDLETYWENILQKVDAIEEIPKEQFDWKLIYDQDPLAKDKISSRWGGFLKDIPFDPSVYGIPPSSLASVDPMQLIILEVTRAALHDAGYQNRPFPKERSSIVLANAGHGPITSFYGLRSMLDWTLSDIDPEYRKELEKRLPEWTEDSFPGYLGNVTAGRVANRFDLGGLNFCVDAACASSLAALYIGIRELRAGSSDVVLLAATDTHNQPGDYLSFSKTHALSPRGKCRTFDATADGIVISEGMAVLVLKRLSDAERDGDRIYAVVKGIGGSSDGRDLSLTAPRPAGQMLALDRAYEDANLSPSTVELVEAHGTGTVAGDKAEIEALSRVFGAAGADNRVCAVGSVKTMIGHTKCAAGLASVIKIAKSLYHRVLPPTNGVETPNPACKFESSPFYINSEPRPWLHDSEKLGYPRRAGVSAFGFGGTNFHTVLEEYNSVKSDRQESAFQSFPTELFAFRSGSRQQLLKSLESLKNACEKLLVVQAQAKSPVPTNEASSLFELAYRHYLSQTALPPLANAEPVFLALIATSADDLLKKIEQAKQVLTEQEKKSYRDPKGIMFEEGRTEPGKIAFLFPGQGSQHLNMLKDLALAFGEFAQTFEKADHVLSGKFASSLSRYVYPTPAFGEEEKRSQAEALTDTHVAQPAVAAADLAAYRLLKSFALRPDMCAGHSFGEYVALSAAGVISEEDLLILSERRGSILKAANHHKAGSMTAVSAGGDDVRRLVSHLDVTLANINSPKQCIISGEVEALAEASRVLDENKVKSKPIAVSAAFHSPLMQPAVRELSQALLQIQLNTAKVEVYSNTLAKPYPHEAGQIASLLCEHLVKPVEFQAQIEKMYEDGARTFIECGPNSVLTGLVSDILAGKPHLTLSLERNGRHGITQLQNMLAAAFVAGLEPDLGRLYKHRADGLMAAKSDSNSSSTQSKSKLLYLINSAHVRRLDAKGATPANRPTEYAFRAAAAASGNPGPYAAQGAAPTQAGTQISAAASAAKNAIPQVKTPQSGSNSNVPSAPPGASAPANNAAYRAEAASSAAQNAAMSSNPANRMPQVNSALNSAASSFAGANNLPQLPAGKGSRDQMMMEFQRTMLEMTNTFLQSQERVMMAYLSGGNLGAGISAIGNPGSVIPPAQVSGQGQASTQAQTQLTEQSSAPAPAQSSRSLPSASSVSAPASHLLNSMQEMVSTLTEQQKMRPNGANGNGELAKAIESTAIGSHGGNGNGNGNGNGKTGGSSSGLDADHLIARLIEIVSERTGYPPEMLDPTLDLEADLGIDSIKRVEILNNFRKLLPEAVQEELESGIEKLAGTKTLQGIIDWIRNDLVTGKRSESPAATPQSKEAAAPANGSEPSKVSGAYIGRALVALKELDSPSTTALKLSGRFILCDSGNAFTKEVESVLKAAGAEVITLSHKACVIPQEASLYKNRVELDLCDESIVQSFSTQFVEKRGRVSGLIHLPALGDMFDEEESRYGVIRSLYVLSRAFIALTGTAQESPILYTFSKLGGSFGINGEEFDALHAALPGFVKTFAKEYPSARARCIDLPADFAPGSIAEVIRTELAHEDKALTEVGYCSGSRVTLEAIPTKLDKTAAKIDLKPGSMVLVTGGARGITAEICLELAEKYKPTFVIVGRGQRPAANEAPEYAGLESQKEIKGAIMEHLRRKGDSLSVPVIEGIYQKLLREREIRSNLKRLEATGARVHYHAIDVRDGEVFAELIDRLYESFGKIDMVIHGAGVIEDGLLKDKTLASFDRVFGTKVDSALTLASRLQLDSLKYLVFFSSVVGRTGNAGQADYVCANEVLNKLALKLNKISSGRVLSVMWGPWRGGMAQPELESVFARYGWSMIEAGDGRTSFMDELSAGKNHEAEVLLVGQIATPKNGKESEHEQGSVKRNGNGKDGERAEIRPRGARINRAEIINQTELSVDLRLKIDPEFDIYLKDHAFDGIPILPMAVATELMAEAAQYLYPNLHLKSLDKLEIPAGVMFENGARDLYISVRQSSRKMDEVSAEVWITTSATNSRKNFHAVAMFSSVANQHTPAGSPFGLTYRELEIQDLIETPSVDFVYRNWLFHGPLFQGISKISLIGRNGISGEVLSTPIEESLKKSGRERWTVDPLMLDSAMQFAGIWARQYMDITVLPIGFSSLKFFNAPLGNSFKVHVSVPTDNKNGELLCDMAIYNELGHIVMIMENLGGAGSKALNRLGTQPKALRNR